MAESVRIGIHAPDRMPWTQRRDAVVQLLRSGSKPLSAEVVEYCNEEQFCALDAAMNNTSIGNIADDALSDEQLSLLLLKLFNHEGSDLLTYATTTFRQRLKSSF